MADFDPDAYLAKNSASFDPDAYLQKVDTVPWPTAPDLTKPEIQAQTLDSHDLNTLRGSDVASGIGQNLLRLGKGATGSIADNFDFKNNPFQAAANVIFPPLQSTEAAYGMGKGMLSQAGNYAEQAYHGAERGDKLAAVTRAEQALLSLVPGASQAVGPSDIDKPIGQAVGSDAVDIALQLLGTKQAGKLGEAALSKAKLPFFLKAPRDRYASVFPDTTAVKAILERNPEVIDDMINNKVQGSAGTIQKQQDALVASRVKAQTATEQAAAGKPTPLDPILDKVQAGKAKWTNQQGTSIDPTYTNTAGRMERLVSELATPTEHLMAASGGPGGPSIVMRPGLSMEDLLQNVKDVPDVGGAYDKVQHAGIPETSLTAPFEEALNLRKRLDEMNSGTYTKMNTPKGQIAARTEAADALRNQLGLTDPAYSKAAGQTHLALSGQTLAEAIKPADWFSQAGIRMALSKLSRSAAGAAISGGPGGALAGAVFDSVVNSPMWKTMSAVKQLELAKTLGIGTPGAATMLGADMMAPPEDDDAAKKQAIETHLKRRGL